MTLDLLIQSYTPIAGLIAVIIWAVRTEAHVKNNIKVIEHLTKSGEGMKKQIDEIRLAIAKLETIQDAIERVEKKLNETK